MKRIILFFLLAISFNSYSQKISFYKKIKIGINKSANKEYQVKFIDPATDTIMKQDTKTYLKDGSLSSYQLIKVLNWEKAKTLNSDSTTLPTFLKVESTLLANIKPDDGRLMIYFWPHKGQDSLAKEANVFYEKNAFSITLEDRTNLAFNSSECIAGVLTLPIKVFVGGTDSVSAVQSSVSAGIYVGKKWGKTKFVKLPNEKEFTVYQRALSLNFVAGLNKLDLDEKNTKDAGDKFKGSVATLSLGTALGTHYKTFTIFLAGGFDIPLSKMGSKWSLKDKPWIGVGAGFEIF